ncbi:MAG: transglycosylase SLT domain-containing protein [Bradyrhizobium sp.]|nr:transglycosylase SLT domain-containing protein [Bradyrhizobium sp.]
MWAAGCVLLCLAGDGHAQQNGRADAVDLSVFTLPPDAEPDVPPPAAVEPRVARQLTPSDLPPANPLVAISFGGGNGGFGRDWHDWRAGREQYRAIVEHEAQNSGLPAALVDAIMAVESRYNPAVIGADGEIGLMQVMLPTARMLGFAGTAEQLAMPATNIHYGAAYLAGAWRLAGGDLCTAAMKYRAGHGETRFSFLSVDYCLRVRAHLAAHGVPVSGSVPQPTFGRPSADRTGGAAPHGRQLFNAGMVNLAALNTRLRALTERKSLRDTP